MNTTRIKKYFAQHLSTIPVVISGISIAIGLVMVVLLSNTRGLPSWIIMPAGFALLGIGVAIFIVRAVIKIPDAEIDEKVNALLSSFESDYKSHFDNTDVHKIRADLARGVTTPKFEPIYFSTYCFESADIPHKRGNDGKSRSALYALSGLLFRPETICIGYRRFSLLEENIKSSEGFFEIEYSALSDALLVEVPNGGYEGATPYRHLLIKGADGETVAELPILADASADEYSKTLKTRIERAKEKLAPKD